MDFNKAFDRVWHAALFATMKKYNISTNLIRVIKNLYDKATSAVLFNGSIGDWFRTTAGIRQGCLLSPTLFKILLERIIAYALEDHEGTVSVGGRTITTYALEDHEGTVSIGDRTISNLLFAYHIDGLSGEV